MTHLDFWVAVAKELLEGHTPRPEKWFCVNREIPLRMTERLFSKRIPKTTPSSGRLQCEVCRARGKKKSQTQVRCKICKTPLHLHKCFEIYHTKLHYNQP